MHLAARESKEIIIIDISGNICRSNVKDKILHRMVKSQLAEGKIDFLLNLEKVDLVDSSGVSEILAIYISIQNAGGRIKLLRIPRTLGIIFSIVGLDRVLDIFQSETSALQSFDKP